NTSSSLAQRYVFPGGADQQLPSPPPAPPMEETAASAPGGSSALTCQECMKQPCTSPSGGPVNLGACFHRCDTACGIKPPVPPPPILARVPAPTPAPPSGGTAARCKTCKDTCTKNPPMPISVGKYGTVSPSDICATKCAQDCSPPVPGHRVFRAYFGYDNPGP